MSCNFTKIFVHLVNNCNSNFNVYKLIGWDPANIYLFKTNSRYTRKKCKKVRNMFKVNNEYSRTSLC